MKEIKEEDVMEKPNPDIAVKALRTEELLVLITDGDMEKKRRLELSNELDRRNIGLKSANRRVC